MNYVNINGTQVPVKNGKNVVPIQGTSDPDFVIHPETNLSAVIDFTRNTTADQVIDNLLKINSTEITNAISLKNSFKQYILGYSACDEYGDEYVNMDLLTDTSTFAQPLSMIEFINAYNSSSRIISIPDGATLMGYTTDILNSISKTKNTLIFLAQTKKNGVLNIKISMDGTNYVVPYLTDTDTLSDSIITMSLFRPRTDGDYLSSYDGATSLRIKFEVTGPVDIYGFGFYTTIGTY